MSVCTTRIRIWFDPVSTGDTMHRMHRIHGPTSAHDTFKVCVWLAFLTWDTHTQARAHTHTHTQTRLHLDEPQEWSSQQPPPPIQHRSEQQQQGVSRALFLTAALYSLVRSFAIYVAGDSNADSRKIANVRMVAEAQHVQPPRRPPPPPPLPTARASSPQESRYAWREQPPICKTLPATHSHGHVSTAS